MGELYKMVVSEFGRLGTGATVALALGLTVLATGLGFATVVLLPSNHFMPSAPKALVHPILRFTIAVARNLLGAVLLALGLVMILPLVPGPGLVFLLLGLSLVTFPGKRKVELRLLNRPGVNRFINGLRVRFGKAPFALPD